MLPMTSSAQAIGLYGHETAMPDTTGRPVVKLPGLRAQALRRRVTYEPGRRLESVNWPTQSARGGAATRRAGPG